MKIYMLVGCPGSGKTWVANQLKDLMNYIPHDSFIKTETTYLSHIKSRLRFKEDKRPILIETPFSISQLKEPLEELGADVETVFIQETDNVIMHRYLNRENKPIPPGHLSRQRTYRERAKEYGSFVGTSAQVFDYLKSKA